MEHIFLLPSDEELQVLEQKINRALLREALQPPNRYNEDGNKSLTLVGDKVLDLVIGKISDMIQYKAGNTYLSREGFRLGLGQLIVKNPSQSFIGNKIMASEIGEHYWPTSTTPGSTRTVNQVQRHRCSTQYYLRRNKTIRLYIDLQRAREDYHAKASDTRRRLDARTDDTTKRVLEATLQDIQKEHDAFMHAHDDITTDRS
ncbi:hypothetical protein N7530_003237 [Penicillium desertorum]|uniref:Uncharacterized protein n=1 Tax=Penicillium desertorum TaxID=1303715 RepID=A0A9X0BPD8_9EURO|nr:hypothetical protein N7530_003237 [Penicillium desertorum]